MAGTGRALGAGVFVAGLLLLLLAAAFPLVQISVGAAFVHECPAAPLLPVYVLVFGILVLLMMLLFAVLRLLCSAAPARITWSLGAVLLLLLLLWILFGSYQVYSIYPPDYQRNGTDPSGPPFCNRSLYLLAFWTTTLLHVLAGSTLLGGLCLCAAMRGVEVFVQHLQR